jgi:hypothetical protein
VFVKLFHKGINSSFEGYYFSGRLVVGLIQSHLFQCYLVHLSCQIVEFVKDCLEGAFHVVPTCTCVLLDELFKIGSYYYIGCIVLKDIFSTVVNFCPKDISADSFIHQLLALLANW